MQAVQGETYDFAAKPKVVQATAKYREQQFMEDEDQSGFQNMMFDKRVVRGNTYAAIVTSKNTDQFKDSSNLVKSIKRPQKQYKEVEEMQEQQEPGTPEPVQGRVHAGLQTDEYVETLTDKPPNYEKDTQTDFYIDRPLVRLFMPKKDGIDRETQIWDGQLFDFDYEVEPILQVLIGKTLEQSRMEVLEEEELRIMKEQQKRFEQLRNAELAEMQKLQAKEERLKTENENRKAQYHAKLEQNRFSHKKMISRVISKNYLSKLQPTVLEVLKEQGVFRHPLQMTLLHKFLPWIYSEVQNELNQKKDSITQIRQLVVQGQTGSQSLHQLALQKEKKRREDELERRRLEQEAKELRIAQRKEAKRKRLEQERRQKLKEQALEQLISKGEQRPNILSLNIADIDFHSPEAPAIGLFGGLIGEVVLFCACLGRYFDDATYPGLKEWVSQSENIVSVFKEMVQVICTEGSLEIQIEENVENKLQELFGPVGEEEGAEPQTLANWHNSPEEKMPEVYEVLKQNIAHLILKTVQNNSEQLQASETAIDECVLCLLKLIYAEDSIQQKVKWVKVAPKETFDQVGIAYLKPDLTQLQVNSKSDRVGEQQEPQNEDEEPKPVVPKNLAEADYENKQTLFNQGNEEIKVLTQHAVAEMFVREEILRNVGMQVGSVQGQGEFNILMDSVDKMKELQTQVLDYIVPDYPVLDMDSY